MSDLIFAMETHNEVDKLMPAVIEFLVQKGANPTTILFFMKSIADSLIKLRKELNIETKKEE